jgi:hypothetical protein
VQQSITTNTLFYGDNLAIMREYIPDESVDLVILETHLSTPTAITTCCSVIRAVRKRKHRLKPLKIRGNGAMLLRKPTMRAN